MPTRRTFLNASLGTALLASTASAEITAVKLKTQRAGGDLLSRMTWFNPPASEHYDDGTLTARIKGKTDFWRKTYYGYVNDSGHFLHVPVTGEFTFTARVLGNYGALYDQAGIMVRIDSRHWMKCGTEFFDGKRWASVVFTHEFSDWSTMEDLTQTGAMYWRVTRKRDSLEAACSKDGDQFITIRQGYFPAGASVEVGVMGAAPEGAGFDATFDQLLLET